jgi:membrane fusion protein (multidrug efflux system)
MKFTEVINKKAKYFVRQLKKSRDKKFFVLFFVLGLSLPISQSYYSDYQNREKIKREVASIVPSDEKAIPVTIRNIEKREISKVFSSFSNLRPIKEMILIPELRVYVKKILVKSGDYVKKGQVLVLFDSESLRLKKELSVIEINAKKSEYELTNALAEKDYVSKNELNQKKLDFKSDEIKRKIEEIDGNSEKFVAPFDGVVADIKLREGDYIDDTFKYFVKVIDNSKFKVELYVPQSVAEHLKRGFEAQFVAENNETAKAVISNIAPTIDPQTGTVYVEVEGLNKNLQWRSGIFVKTDLYLEKKKDTLAIKNQSILYDKGKAFVFRVIASNNENTAEKVYLNLGITDGDFVEVKNGIGLNDQIIIEGQSSLKDHSKIEIFSQQNK